MGRMVFDAEAAANAELVVIAKNLADALEKAGPLTRDAQVALAAWRKWSRDAGRTPGPHHFGQDG